MSERWSMFGLDKDREVEMAATTHVSPSTTNTGNAAPHDASPSLPVGKGEALSRMT